MKFLDEALTKFNRWVDTRLFRVARATQRIDDLIENGKSPEQAAAEVEADIAKGVTAWMPLPRKKGAKKVG